MKLNISLMKLTIKLLVLIVLVAMLFLISVVLYSMRYWPDVYNYVHANITIKRIPTLTELNYTVYEVRVTETQTTIDDTTDGAELYTESDFEGFNLDDIDFEKKKRHAEFGKDYSEVPTKAVLVDYFFDLEDQTTKIIKDLIDESKLTTADMKDVEMLIDFDVKASSKAADNENDLTDVLSSIAAIFVKNSTNDQFNYYCDGALLSNEAIITAASCVHNDHAIVKSSNLIVLLGKQSLTTMAESEMVVRVKKVVVNGNYSNDGGDLAILVTEEPINFSKGIQAARFSTDELKFEKYLTTGWAVTGELTPIYMKRGEDVTCDKDTGMDDTFCAVYGNDVTVCPSYGGVFVGKQQDTWYLQGIRTGDPSDRGLCINRQIDFTSLTQYWNWIKDSAK